jgi:UDP-N-acetylmuramyl tripeptide synthase
MGARAGIAKAAGDASAFVLRHVFGRHGGQLPGRIALAVDPNLMAELAPKARRGSIVVCGTNGKTTTNNIVAAALEACGMRVLCNRDGANMAAGVTAALLPSGEYDWAVMEADELSTIHILPSLRPRYLVLLNLFRDQLDRAGEIDHVQETIEAALAASPETTLLVCGDDPLSMGVARVAAAAGTKVLCFGIGEDLGLEPERVAEARFCQVCGAPLGYDYRTYAQLGAFRCPNGDFVRPALDFSATDVVVGREGVSFVAHDARRGTEAAFSAAFGGVYMVYNLLAAWSVASLVGVGPQSFQHVLDGYHPENGRLQRFRVEGREVILNLAKNPTGFNQNISLLLSDDRPKAAYLVINDDFNDGKDISWIWDMDLERLADGRTSVLAGGSRANDVQVRCKYAGISARLATSVSDALRKVADLPVEQPLYVLCNYSALWPAKAELERMGERL